MFNVLKLTKHFVTIKHYAYLLLFSAVYVAPGIQIAFAEDTANWQKIQEADASLSSVRLKWHYIRVIGPQSPTSESTYKGAAKRLRDKGMDTESAERITEASRTFDKESERGIEYKGEMECLRFNNEMRLNMTFSQKSGNTRTPKKLIINYTDGKTGLSIDRVDTNGKSIIPQWGQVITDEDPHKTLVAMPSPLVQLLLFAKPLTDSFPPAETKMIDKNKDVLILETVENVESDFPVTIRAEVSKTTYRPIKIERFPPHTTSPSKVFEASDFHDYGDNTWLPTRVTYKMPALHDVISYTLQTATVREDISDEDIKIMYGPNIQDCRFDDCIQYKLVSGIIPDEEKINELKSGAPSEEIPSDDEHSMEKPPLFALLLLGLGSVSLWGGNLIYNAYKK